MKYLWQDLDEITLLLKKDCPKVLFLDFDGTLTPIVKSPKLANISKGTQRLLQSLCQKPNFYVAVVSGRQLNDLEQRVGIPDIIYASKHGFKGEIQHKQYIFPVKKSGLIAIRKIKEQLQEVTDQFNGAFIEDKKIMLAFHFRAVDKQRIPQLKLSLKKILKNIKKQGLVSTILGKKVLEILPKAAWNKGYFADMVMKKIAALTKKKPVAIVIGDDKTDEDTFQKLNKEITITVGRKRQSKAKYYLKDPEDVIFFLNKLKVLV